MNHRWFVATLLLFYSVFPAASEIEIFADAITVPGQPFGVYLVTDESLADVVASLHEGGSVIATTRTIGYSRGAPVGKVYAALLAVPSTSVSDQVLIRFSFVLRDARRMRERFIEIKSREFRSETIEFDETMTNLRRNDRESIVEEAEILWSILLSSNDDADFHRSEFLFPIEKQFRTSYFGDRRTYVYSDDGTSYSLHNGVDYRGSTGTTVRAAGRGRVVFAGTRIITGVSVIIEHLPGVYTLYYHLDTAGVGVGEIVEPGEAIGSVGSTGLVTGPHLHWELRVAGVAADPEYFIARPMLDKLPLLLHIVR